VKIEHQLIGEARKTERVTKGLSLRKQAIQLGVSKSQLWAMEKGIRKWKVQN
jgi:transcriptional regulator with XRE-family HTH domain